MRMKHLSAIGLIVCAMTLTAAAADTNVTLSDVHLCCSSCVKGVNTALSSVAGAKAVCDQDANTIAITAPDVQTAQKAVDALVAAGYFGASSNSAIKVAAPAEVPGGNVQSMTVSGVHLCCGSCVTAVKGVLGKIDGVTGNTVASKASSFNVTGNFSAQKLMDELNKAGLTGKVASTSAAAGNTPAAR